MTFFLVLLVAGAAVLIFLLGARIAMGPGRGRGTAAQDHKANDPPQRDLNANINPSQTGNELDLFPDRTGARTRLELGAKDAANVSYTGIREEHRGGQQEIPGHNPGAPARQDPAPGAPAGGLALEAVYGEDRPANRTEAPDQPPTQYHPPEHGRPGEHLRAGHIRSATAPTNADVAGPPGEAPLAGPRHVPPADGVPFPPDIRP